MTSIRFTATAKPVKADPDSIVKLQNLPAENAGIRIESGSSGQIKWGGKATAFSFDVDARQSVGRAFRLPKNTIKDFSIAGGPIYFTVGSAEWLS